MSAKQTLKEQCLDLLKKYTRHNTVKITNSGDSAIFGALSIAKQLGCNEVLIPDQGGWIAYKTFPKLLGLKITEFKTEYGIIKPEELKKYKQKNATQNITLNTALLFASFAGYAAPQDVEALSQVCNENNIFMIEDAAGSLSHPILCNGKFSDIIVGSFGKWKTADLGYGGFFSAKDRIITEEIKDSDILLVMRINKMDYGLLLEKLQKAPERLHWLINKTKEIKELCRKEGFKLIHEDAEGIGIFVKYNTEDEKYRILDFCKKNRIEYKECPLYIKVMEKAISLEIKRFIFSK